MLILAMLICLPALSPAATATQLSANATQERTLTFDVPPQIINGRTMVPLRAIFEELGAEVLWNGPTQTVTATRGDTVVTLTIGSTAPTVNGRVVEIDQPGVVVGGRTLVPLRFVGEAFGAEVNWDSATRTVTITDDAMVLVFSVPAEMRWRTVTTDWMRIDIPSTWSWKYDDDHPGDIYITSDDGSISIFVGYMIAGDPMVFLAQTPSTPFRFDSGSTGYMIETPEVIRWLNPDLYLGSGVAFFLGGNRTTYTNNEEVILKIARSYRSL